MAYIDTKYLGKCETCRHCVGDIKCSTYCDHGEEYSPNLSKIPTADVVEVVRCKDCKHCELRYPAKAIGEEAIEGYYCYPNQRYVKSTDFCNYGEKGEEK